MKSTFAEDAMRWEAGELLLEVLVARHPEEDVQDLAEVWGQLAAIAEAPTPDPEPSWTALHAQLPAPALRQGGLRTTERLRWRMRRSVAGLTAAAPLGGTSIAYAAGVAPVRRGVDQVVDHVSDFFLGEDSGNTDTDQRDSGQGEHGNTGTDEGDPGTDQDDWGTDQGNAGTDEGNSGTDEGNSGGNQGSSDQGNSGTDEGTSGDNNGSSDQGDRGNKGTDQNSGR